MVWFPIFLVFFYLAVFTPVEKMTFADRFVLYSSSDFNVLYIVLGLLLSVGIWTKFEYLLHRFLMHLDENIPNNKVAKFIHFFLHGLHHLFPLDGERVPLPNYIVIPTFLILYKPVTLLFPGAFGRLIFAGLLLCYNFYEYIHYFTHSIPSNAVYWKGIKAYHMKHHLSQPNTGYGVTNKIWDKVYGTVFI